MNTIDIDHGVFRRLDLNLLVAFDALVSESSVTRAAARLCIGQPAMSHALGRLRELFGDDILYRDGSAMRPTQRAAALAPRVRRWLDDACALTFSDIRFDPMQASGQFRLALNDPLEALLLPGLVARLRSQAPGLALTVRPIPASLQLEHLDQGNIRLTVGYYPKVREVHEQTLLYRTGFSCVYNPGLLELPSPPDLESLIAHPHIHTTYTGDMPGLVDSILQKRGLKRHVVARASTPLSIPFVVKQSPLVAVLPELVTRLFLGHADLRIEPLVAEGLEFPISMVTHRRDRSDPLTAFVMEQMVSTMRALFGDADNAPRASR